MSVEIKKLYLKTTPETKPDVEVKAPEPEQLKPDTDPALEMSAEELERASRETDEVVSLVTPELKILSEVEDRDLEMNTSISGWKLYWRNRLAPELDILPESVRPILERLLRNLKLTVPENAIFRTYVVHRINTLRRREPVTRIQRGKQAEMAKLRNRLQDIDERKDYEESEQKQRKTVFYDHESEAMFIVENDVKKNLTVGDIVADQDWGIKYRPDSGMPDLLWRKIRKLSDYVETKRNVEELSNRELEVVEGVGHGAGVAFSLDKLMSLDTSAPGEMGFIAERMVPGFLTRIQYNHPELGFKIERSNVVEDTELKYDFKVHFSSKLRGVAVEGDDMPREDYVDQKRRIGWQFTTVHKGGVLKKKKRQVEEAKKLVTESRFSKYVKKQVDDIVIMSLPFRDCGKDFQQWLDGGQPSGGPEQFMSPETKKAIIKKVFEGRIELTDEQIDELIA